ncbi:unnamed protein product [Polarella glacialis]|uniref:Uncharacterized protein n=1 Tax=Polarella glacialis TaxID=89957 RepID=A0A813HQR0_POLGL|nr:unnamed protein product [Polarella glacialis]
MKSAVAETMLRLRFNLSMATETSDRENSKPSSAAACSQGALRKRGRFQGIASPSPPHPDSPRRSALICGASEAAEAACPMYRSTAELPHRPMAQMMARLSPREARYCAPDTRSEWPPKALRPSVSSRGSPRWTAIASTASTTAAFVTGSPSQDGNSGNEVKVDRTPNFKANDSTWQHIQQNAQGTVVVPRQQHGHIREVPAPPWSVLDMGSLKVTVRLIMSEVRSPTRAAANSNSLNKKNDPIKMHLAGS